LGPFLGLVDRSSFLLLDDIKVSFSLVGDTKVSFGEEHSSVVNSANAGDISSICREEVDEPNCMFWEESSSGVDFADGGDISSICNEENDVNSVDSDRRRWPAGVLGRFLGLVGGTSLLRRGDIKVSFFKVPFFFFGESVNDSLSGQDLWSFGTMGDRSSSIGNDGVNRENERC
jgi:hypothetical protein